MHRFTLFLVAALCIGCTSARSRSEEKMRELGSGEVWTTWSTMPFAAGLLYLEASRQQLFSKSLFDTHRKLRRDGACAPERRWARTVDGTCNHLDSPWMGAANMRFGRNVPREATFPEPDHLILSPNPRRISRELMTRKQFIPVENLNLLAAAWIQFMTHDWFFHGDNEAELPFKIALDADDPLAQPEMLIPRTRKDRTREPDEEDEDPPTFVNTVTHWWDASQVYGSDEKTSSALRTFKDGKLTVDGRGRLPMDSVRGFEATGFQENWWIGLSALHHIFALEHNAVAEHLKRAHPDWDDQKLFDKSRLVVAALLAKIHTVEWTPAILTNEVLERAMNINWHGLLESIDGTGMTEEASVSGIVGGKLDLHGVPFSLTEEFTSVYRMHPLLPDSITLRSAVDGKTLRVFALEETREKAVPVILDEYPLETVVYSFGRAHPGALTLNNYPKALQNLTIPIAGPVDMAALDVMRDRERGVPRYNKFRRLLHLKPIRTFEDLSDDTNVVQRLRKMYDGDVEKIDLLIGCLAETRRPRGFGFGETAFQVFILMASRRLQADRFFTDDYRPEVYSTEGIAWVRDNTMKTVLLRHFPVLQRPMSNVANAFRPWAQ